MLPEVGILPHFADPLIFETHATSLDNEAGLASGWFDVDLSPAGERQARELGRRYRLVAEAGAAASLDERAEWPAIAAVYCSDLRRAWRTAALAFGEQAPIVRDPRLRECDYGLLTRAPVSEVDARRRACVDVPFPSGESYADAVRRVESFLRERLPRPRRERVLIIGHRATHDALDHLILGRPLHELIAQAFHWQPGWTYPAAALARFSQE